MHPGITRVTGNLRKAGRFIGSEIWHINTRGLSRLHALLVRVAKSIIFLYHQFWEDRLLTRASALTFSSLLALVPLLAIVFTVYQSLGLYVDFEPTLREWLSPLGSDGDIVATQIMDFLANAQTGTLGYIGLVVLLFAVLGILANIEESYNDIWHVRHMRSWRQRLVSYLALLLTGPLIISGVVTFMGSSDSIAMLANFERIAGFSPLSVLLIGLFFTLIIWSVPNTRVSIRSALVGGMISGCGWILLNRLFAQLIADTTQASAREILFAGFAALPLFLIWLYLGWVILLLGAILAYSIQNVGIMEWRQSERVHGTALRSYINVLAFLYIIRNFVEDNRPTRLDRLSGQTGAPENVLDEMLSAYVDSGLLMRKSGYHISYTPAASPEDLPLRSLLNVLYHPGPLPDRFQSVDPLNALARDLLQYYRTSYRYPLDQSLTDTVLSLTPPRLTPDEHAEGDPQDI
ncbi:MAG: YihY/virulence factor BrkB family protein [Gemmatimonadetes bacterium]|nr:YihY/virulence factor BrkB family protein [Gemmatimonadota bacterium]MYG16483.1 YihY/virulence factor BrkB family protein [Gemmatimonadota bacterium]